MDFEAAGSTPASRAFVVLRINPRDVFN